MPPQMYDVTRKFGEYLISYRTPHLDYTPYVVLELLAKLKSIENADSVGAAKIYSPADAAQTFQAGDVVETLYEVSSVAGS